MADTDKVTLGYLPTYHAISAQIGPAGRVCEVGVWRGGSLELWQRLFPYGLVVGVDQDPGARWPPGTRRVVAEQTDDRLPGRLVAISPAGFDLIVEDAAHDGAKTRRTFELLWPLVTPGGWYVVEDWQIGFPTWDAAVYPTQPSMVDAARSFLDLLDRPDGDVEDITYRYGQIILHKKDGHAS